ncbi:MAG TPA: mycofactocin precursor MftA [Candidatus Dormibacteraeota bacterium]|nr:mycofactocin precursor MftA [Candidatus Dormibacteraeota bacterium]
MVSQEHLRRDGSPAPRSRPEATIIAREVEDEPDYGAEMSDQELSRLLVREVTIDGMCGVY